MELRRLKREVELVIETQSAQTASHEAAQAGIHAHHNSLHEQRQEQHHQRVEEACAALAELSDAARSGLDSGLLDSNDACVSVAAAAAARAAELAPLLALVGAAFRRASFSGTGPREHAALFKSGGTRVLGGLWHTGPIHAGPA